MSNDLSIYARTLVGKPATPYTGQLTADMGGGERDILAAINRMVIGGDGGSAPTGGFSFGPERNTLISDILSGRRMSPTANPFLGQTIDAIRSAGQDTLGSNLNMVDAAYGKANLGAGSGRTGAIGDVTRSVTGDINNQIATILGNNYQQGLQEQMQTLSSILPGMDAFTSNLLFSALGANALPRSIEQDELSAQYAEFQRMLNESLQNTSMANSILSGAPGMQFMSPQYRPSSASQLLAALSQMGQAAAPAVGA